MSISNWPRKFRQHFKHRPSVIAYIFYVPIRLVIAFFSVLPYKILKPLASVLGLLVLLFERRRRVGLQHLSHAFPGYSQKKLKKVLRQSCQSIALSAVEAIILAPRYQQKWRQHIDFGEGVEEKLRSYKNKGAIFVQGHFGSFEFGGAALGVLGLEPAFPMRLPNNYYLGRDLINARKQGWGVEIITRKGAVRQFVKRLKEGKSIVTASDQSAHHQPIFIPWFGKLAATERSTAALALKFGSPVIGLWCLRDPKKARYTVYCETIRESGPAQDADQENVYNLLLDIHSCLERQILQHPEQYLWVHDRYRIRPNDELNT